MQHVAQLIIVLCAALAALIVGHYFDWLLAPFAFALAIAVLAWLTDYEEYSE